MRIAYYSHYFSPEVGAPSARIYDLSQQWLRLGHQVEVVTCFPNHPTGKLYPGYRRALRMREVLDGIEVYRHWTYITPKQGLIRRTLGHISYFPSSLVLSNRRRSAPDVVIGTSPTFFAAMAASHIARRHEIPFVMEVRDLWPSIFAELGVLKSRFLIRCLERLEMRLYRQAERVVTVTEAFRMNLISRGVPAGKVATIPNGADVEFWQPVDGTGPRARLNFGESFVVLYIGAHGISQALSRILISAKLLLQDRRIRFLLVGDGAEKEALVRKAREEALTNVTFLGSVGKSEVRDLYSLADVCLVPLRDIPLFGTFVPSKMFEIMAMGRPIVASVRGEAADILRRSGGGVIVAPEDSQGISEAIRMFCDDRSRAREVGRRGREFVVENYSRQALAAKYAYILSETVAQKRGLRT